MSSLASFIAVFSKNISVPYDLIQLIKLFFGGCKAGWNTRLFCSKRSILYNPTWGKSYDLHHKSNIHQFPPQYIVNHTSLPECIKHQYKDYKYPIPISSNKWCMMFQTGIGWHDQAFYRHYKPFISGEQSKYYVTAFHSQLLFSGNFGDKYESIRFTLPSLPQNVIGNTAASVVYNQKDVILYAANMSTNRMKSIYSLNLSTLDCQWNEVTNNLLIQRYDTLLCMVDNDRFIAILGGANDLNDGNDLNKAELYALNCNKSILISEMNGRYTKYAKSLYHKKFHKIVVCNKYWNGNMEWYDINKDKWIVMKTTNSSGVNNNKYTIVQQMIVPEDNPNVIFVGCNRDYKYEIQQIDLRTNTYENCAVWNDYETVSDDCENCWLLQM